MIVFLVVMAALTAGGVVLCERVDRPARRAAREAALTAAE